MGVMVLAPANNFERHMLPITFVFFFTALTFLRESKLLGRDNIIDITSNTKIENTSQLPQLPKLNIETIGGDK